MKHYRIAKLFTLISLGLTVSACSSAKLNDDPGAQYKNYSEQQLFILGEKAVARHNYSGAVRYFQALDALHPFNVNSEQAQRDIIYAYYKTKDYPSAEAAAERYIRVYPQGAHVDYAYYLKGLSQMAQSRTFLQRILPVDIAIRDETTIQDAFYSFRNLVQDYPNSSYAPDARARLIYLRDIFAQHELEVAHFYYQRGAYHAAINRADYIIAHYQQTPQIKQALQLLIKANEKLGLHETAEQARDVLQQNFPGKS
jgi:outer membrane protein assembly factor BamD